MYVTAERRIRVHTLCIPVTENLDDVFHNADQQAITCLIAKMGKEYQERKNNFYKLKSYNNYKLCIVVKLLTEVQKNHYLMHVKPFSMLSQIHSLRSNLVAHPTMALEQCCLLCH